MDQSDSKSKEDRKPGKISLEFIYLYELQPGQKENCWKFPKSLKRSKLKVFGYERFDVGLNATCFYSDVAFLTEQSKSAEAC